ncbi:hypothetical protein T265_10164 [Opisthorchis viverrini]|uniref:Uncharacterized protein n=1 Tax=Opisthorchis viverrini TaxID=6198 RepID=A0A074Z7I0_OPIVI|nr:hypothetical protein T265_10164 [Opisthorchis viverrini]KER21542.1 hypothetical protein T265_10164 [Opisthorchis viverrini]
MGSDPRRAMSSAYSISVSGGPGSTSTTQALEAGSESSMIISLTKLKRKGERGQPCRTPPDVVNSGESFSQTFTRPRELAYSALMRVKNLWGTPLHHRHCHSAWRFTESKAAFRSRNTTIVGCWKQTIINHSTVAPFRCPAAMPPKGSTRAGILPGYPSVDRESREAEVGFEPRTFWSVNSRSNHLSHLASFPLESTVTTETVGTFKVLHKSLNDKRLHF